MSADAADGTLAAWLAELEKEHEARALVIASIRQRLGLDPSGPIVTSLPAAGGGTLRTGSDVQGGPLRSDTFFRLSIPEAIKKFLNIAKRPQTPKDIAAALKQGGVLTQSSHFYANVTTALKRLRDAGDVVNTKEGWGLSEWYPNKPKAEPPKKRAKKKRRLANVTSQAAAPTAAAGSYHSSYNQFMAEQRRAGKSMSEIAAAWKAKKAGG